MALVGCIRVDTKGPHRLIAVMHYDLIETPLGWMGLLASSVGLRRTTLPQPTPEASMISLGVEAMGASHDPKPFLRLKQTIDLYYAGQPASFLDEATDLHEATTFQQATWVACRSIPTGETRSYKWLASQAGHPNASRPAGRAMATNRLPLIVPCHRVILSNGGLGGFGRNASQMELKRRLLDLETEARRS